jgi:hypothetical protein
MATLRVAAAGRLGEGIVEKMEQNRTSYAVIRVSMCGLMVPTLLNQRIAS